MPDHPDWLARAWPSWYSAAARQSWGTRSEALSYRRRRLEQLHSVLLPVQAPQATPSEAQAARLATPRVRRAEAWPLPPHKPWPARQVSGWARLRLRRRQRAWVARQREGLEQEGWGWEGGLHRAAPSPA